LSIIVNVLGATQPSGLGLRGLGLRGLGLRGLGLRGLGLRGLGLLSKPSQTTVFKVV
jgi:hypothetical protein